MEKTPSPSSLTEDERFMVEQIVVIFAYSYAHMVIIRYSNLLKSKSAEVH